MSKSITVDPYNVNKARNFVEEAGNYNVELENVHYKSKNSKGNEMITFDAKVIDGDYQGSSIKYNNLSWNEETKEKQDASIKRFNSMAIALGASKDAQVTIEQIAKGMAGKKINIYADWEDPNDKGISYLKARQYFLLDPEGSKPNGKKAPSQDDKANTSKSTKTSNGNGDPFKAAPGETIDISDDDLPF